MPGLTLQIDSAQLEALVRSVVEQTIAAMVKVRAAPPPRHADAERERLLLTPREAAKAMGISERNLWDLTSPRGPVPVVVLGPRTIRYDPADLKAFFAEQKAAAAERPAELAQENGRHGGPPAEPVNGRAGRK
jgi:hypothetical protein